MRIPRRQLQPFTHRWPVGHPPLWIALIAANAGCFVTQQLIDYPETHLILNWFGLSKTGVEHSFLWQFFTYSFLHGEPMNVLGSMILLGNMLLLYFAGRELEALIGPRHFLTVYFGGGLLGGLSQWAFTPLASPLIGASACVFATLIAFTTMLPELELTGLLFYIIPIRLKSKYLAAILVTTSAGLLLTRAVPSVSHYANLGGCLFGWLYVKQLGYGNPWWLQRYIFEKRQRAERCKNMTADQFISEEVDPVLEKISRAGMRSLTRAERRTLRMGSDKIEKR